MKNTFNILFAVLGLSGAVLAQKLEVQIKGNIFNSTSDSVYLSQFTGNTFVNLGATKLDSKGNFAIKSSIPNPDFYVLRVGDSRVNLILRENSDIKVYADGKNMMSFCNIVGSDESANMKEFIQNMEYWNQKRNQAMIQMQQFPDKEAEIRTSLDSEYSMFVSNRQSYIAQNPNSPILLPALTTIDPETDWATYDMVAKQLNGSLPGSPTIQNAYNSYLQMRQQKEAMNFLAPGKPAPNFEETTLTGGKMKLSDLKGQVVLLDFWASWCGPCRQENPNVVKLYEKYKNKGFTIMSVSLDQDKTKWEAAIKKDNLSWPHHVSDLKGWASAAGKMYAVRGIPFTVLIDREGNIIDTKLRGAELERELARIFGE
jgi:thiol-disulfide isomerase/thioredoxin